MTTSPFASCLLLPQMVVAAEGFMVGVPAAVSPGIADRTPRAGASFANGRHVLEVAIDGCADHPPALGLEADPCGQPGDRGEGRGPAGSGVGDQR